MIIANKYNHLNALEYLIVNKDDQYNEILNCIKSIDANLHMKISGDKANLGKVYYNQDQINKAFVKTLNTFSWHSRRIEYYVTGDETTTRDIIHIREKAEQLSILEERGLKAYSTYNQVDFQKDRVAVEVQFGKYFSVAYDLHVKHTFFYSRNDIDVGIEVIPTKAMEEHMDTGVPWFENEVTNVIREGRTNPPIPILILGIEPEIITSFEPTEYSDDEIIRFLHQTSTRSMNTLRRNIQEAEKSSNSNSEKSERVKKVKRCLVILDTRA